MNQHRDNQGKRIKLTLYYLNREEPVIRKVPLGQVRAIVAQASNRGTLRDWRVAG